MFQRIILLSILPFFMTSCFIEKHKEALIGDWKTVDWTIEATGEKISQYKMDFHFGDDGRYKVDYGREVEDGEWRVSGNNLLTTQDGMAQKKVRIISLQKDTLRFEMNRSGRIEVVTLVKD